MVTSVDHNVRKFKYQSEILSLVIQSAQEPKRWEKNTVTVGKGGGLEFVGGQVKPKDPPAFRVLTDDEMTAYRQGRVKTLADLDEVRKQKGGSAASTVNGKLSPSVLTSAKTSIDAAKKSIMDAFDSIKANGSQFATLWSDTSITDIKNQIRATLGMMGSKAKQAFVDITKFFSDAVSNFNESDSGKDSVNIRTGEIVRKKRTAEGVIRDSNKAWSDAGKGFAESETGRDIANTKKAASEFAAKMKKEVDYMATVAMENIEDASDDTKGQVIAGVGAAMAVISGFVSAMASKADAAQVSGEFASNAKSTLVGMLNKLSIQMAGNPDSAIPSNVLRKMLQSIRNIDSGMEPLAKKDTLSKPKEYADSGSKKK